MNYYIVGTAGHVDHGKSMLIKALTGEETDRLKEEKTRGISIELGFASLTLPSGAKAGVVDVPGHEKFIRQMLAGIGGIDLVMLVIAADEGVMPQTKEHLEILDLLQVRQGFVVLNKVDLVDQEWSDLVKLEIEEALKGTVLEGAEIIEASALTGLGIDFLKKKLDEQLNKTPARNSVGPCRLPVDRVFTIAGFGTVVTGTMYSGNLKVGDQVVVEPVNIETRVRSLQVHGVKVEKAFAGQRVAVNLANVDIADVERGSTLLTPGYLRPARILDLSLKFLDSSPKNLTHRQRVRFHIGTQEVLGRVHLLDREEFEPGQSGYVQILLEDMVVATRGDKFVIRQYSPARTIGGGTVLDSGTRKYKRFDRNALKQLEVKESGSPAQLVYEKLLATNIPLDTSELAKTIGLTQETLLQAIEGLGDDVTYFNIDGQKYWIAIARIQYLIKDLEQVLDDYHRKFPLRPGFPKEELKTRLFNGWSSKLYSGLLAYLEEQRFLQAIGNHLKLQSFELSPTGNTAKLINTILQTYENQGLTPPDWESILRTHKINQELGGELLQFLLRQGDLVKVGNGLLFPKGAVEKAKEQILALLAAKKEFTASEAREVLSTSRKFLIPLLEYFDSLKITRRVGEKRIKF